MKTKTINNVTATYSPNMSQSEVIAYIDHVEKRTHQGVQSINIELDGEFVNLSYELKPVPFERIRRITGYLSTTTTWNESKQAELADRTKNVVGMDRI